MIEIIKETIRYRELMFGLANRSIKIHYKQTFLGIAWALFPPLATMLIFTFINKAKIISIETEEIPYPVFAYCGLLPWTFFVSSLTNATKSLVDYSTLITKIYFPKEIIPLSVILSKLVDLCITSFILIGLMLFYDVKLHLTIVAVPLILLIQIVLIMGLSLFLSMGHLFYRDVGYIIDGVVPLSMFITSVVYPIKVASPQLQGILTTLNPMIPIIDSYRDLILRGRWPDITTLVMPLCLSFSLFVIGLLWFHKTEHLFAENV